MRSLLPNRISRGSSLLWLMLLAMVLGCQRPSGESGEGAGESKNQLPATPDVPAPEHSPAEDPERVKTSPSASRPGPEVDSVESVGQVQAAARSQLAPMHQPLRPPVADPAVQPASAKAPSVVGEKDQRPALFDGWQQPRAVLLFTGRQHGYIEPCGCTGLDRAKGGLARRQTLVRELTERGWPVVPMDLGDQVRRFGRQAEIKYQMTIEGLKTIGYQSISFGPEDLRLSLGEIVAILASHQGDESPFVSANVTILDPSFIRPYQVLQVGDQRIGVTAILGSEEQQNIQSDEIVFRPPVEALSEVWPQLAAENCDVYVLLANASLKESRELAQQFSGFHVVVTAGGASEPPLQAEVVPGTETRLVELGGKAMYVAAIGIFDDPQQPLRYERIPLDHRFQDSRPMLDLLAAYQAQLEQLGLEGLGLRPIAHPSGNTFVGAQVCGECHSTAFDIWSETRHAHATESLVQPGERTEIPRHHDPECLSCHVTGWHPQQYFPYATGSLGLETTAHLHGNGCENCHGPGSAHVAAESGDTDADETQLIALREQMRLPLAEAEKRCMTCHDLDNSPDFHQPGAFEKYWEQVKHYED